MPNLIALLVVAATAAYAATDDAVSRVRYDGHAVLRLTWDTSAQRDAIMEMMAADTKRLALDWWREPRATSADVRVPPGSMSALKLLLAAANVTVSTMIPDLQARVDAEAAATAQRRPYDPTRPEAFSLTQYNTYEDIEAWTRSLPKQYPNLATVFKISDSFEGRNINAIKISSNKGTNGTNAAKKAMFFDGGIHSREWIAPATVIYMLDQLLSQYGKDNAITKVVDALDFYILPLFNVDGYAYTWSKDRMWRKTRSTQKGHICVGVDPNRNWDYQWDGAGTSNDPCTDTYAGPKAFSEVEVRSVGEFIKATPAINGYINFHSYSQLWMSPWGYTTKEPVDFKVQNDVSKMATEAIAKVYGTKYEYGPIATTIYPASGSSADYTYGAANVLFSYGVELRDTGQHGFLLPADQIEPSGKETLQAILVMAEAIIGHD